MQVNGLMIKERFDIFKFFFTKLGIFSYCHDVIGLQHKTYI